MREEVYRTLNTILPFLMDETGHWRLSPAYDMTYIFNVGGFLPEKMHCMMMQGKLQGQIKEDALLLAKDNGIRKAETIINEVAEAISHFRQYAEECDVSQQWIGAVEATLKGHLADWGLLEQRKDLSFSINGTLFENVRVERTYKGNYHLLCDVDGKERKFVITDKKYEYALIDKVGTDNLIKDQLVLLVKKFLVR